MCWGKHTTNRAGCDLVNEGVAAAYPAPMPSIDQLHRALAADPNDAFLLYGLAMEHAKLDDHEPALGYFRRAIEADPANAYHHYHMARSLEALGREADARATLEAGLKQAQTHGDHKAIGEITDYLHRLGEDD